MGAHTIGVMRRNVLGFDGRNGWTTNNLRFDNEYNRVFLRDFYSALVKMVNVGYAVDDESCDANNVCRLKVKG